MPSTFATPASLRNSSWWQGTAALRALLRNVLVYVAEPRTAERVLALADDLTAAVPCHQLEFRKDAGVATVLGISPARVAS